MSRSGTGSQENCAGASLLLAMACSAVSTSWRRALCCSHWIALFRMRGAGPASQEALSCSDDTLLCPCPLLLPGVY